MNKILNISLIVGAMLAFSSNVMAQEQNQASQTPTVQASDTQPVPENQTQPRTQSEVHPVDAHTKHRHHHHKHGHHGKHHKHHRHHRHHGRHHHKHFHKMGGMRGHMMKHRLHQAFKDTRELHLTHEQHEKISAIMQGEKENFKNERQKFKETHKQVSELKSNDPDYQNKRNALADQVAQESKDRFNHREDLRKQIFDTLTPEQQAKANGHVLDSVALTHSEFAKHHHCHHHKHGKHHHGHHWKHHHHHKHYPKGQGFQEKGEPVTK